MKKTLTLLFLAATPLAAQTLDDLTPPQAPPVVPPPPPPTCGKAIGAGAVSNFMRIVVGPMLSQTIAREILVTRNPSGGADIQITGRLTQQQITDVWQSIRAQWPMPTNTVGRTPHAISLTPTNGQAYVRIEMAQ